MSGFSGREWIDGHSNISYISVLPKQMLQLIPRLDHHHDFDHFITEAIPLGCMFFVCMCVCVGGRIVYFTTKTFTSCMSDDSCIFKSDLTVTVVASCEELVQWAECGADANVESSVST